MTTMIHGARFGSTATPGKIAKNTAGQLVVPEHVSIPTIAGDGIGPEIMPQAQRVVDAAVYIASGGKQRIQWLPLEIGEKALAAGKKLIPDEVLQTLKDHRVFIKGPVNTPVGGGFRSVNVELRKLLDLFACVRPIKFIPGVISPMKPNVEKNVDVVLFRENTEDVYQGIEYENTSWQARLLRSLQNRALPVINAVLNKLAPERFPLQAYPTIPDDGAIGFKPISEAASKRLIRKAIDYAIDHGHPSVTLVGKGNIMKHTEGAFLKWGQEVGKEYGDKVITPEQFGKDYGWNPEKVVAAGKVVLQERLTDNMFQEVILKPENHSVVATMNLNGDYLSDAFAATVEGLGVAPGANIGDDYAMFESTHGSAPDIAGQNKANPTALMLTMSMMLDHIGWSQAADLVRSSVAKTLGSWQMTGDLSRQVSKYLAQEHTTQRQALAALTEGESNQSALLDKLDNRYKAQLGRVQTLSTSAFTDAVLSNMPVVVAQAQAELSSSGSSTANTAA